MPKNPYYSGPPSDHFDGTRFFIDGYRTDKAPGDILKWMRGGARATWPRSFPATGFDNPPARVDGPAIRVCAIGHASFLIQTAGVNLLVDPVYAQRASPFRFAGPKRVNPPGLPESALPPLDAVLVSHNHYDHMDVAALSRLARTRPCRVITPLGNDAILKRADPAIRAEAHDWGDRVEIAQGVAVHLEPSYHWSARWIGDRRMALWCAFAIETPHGRILHIADTALHDGAIFHETREKHGGFRLAILPIGAYAPRWFMKMQHVDPDEAVELMKLVGAQEALAHHWGTFQLTDEPIHEPVERLKHALLREGVDPARFHVKRPGEALSLAF